MSSLVAGEFKKLIVAADGSEYSLKAAAVAVKLARLNGAQVYVVTVLSVPEYLVLEGNISPEALNQIYSDSRAKAEALVNNIVAMAKSSGVEAKGEILANSRSIVQTIVDYSAQQGIDLIVLGTRGMGGLKRALLGSVSSGVATHAHCSVLIVR